MKDARGYIRISCPGSDNPKQCLNCQKPVCIFDAPQLMRKQRESSMTPEERKEFGKWLRGKREALGLSRTQLSAQLGVSSAALVRWEYGENVPRDSALQKIKEVVGE